jgi:putative spermidine/putrescine transport system substrate-binding protein
MRSLRTALPAVLLVVAIVVFPSPPEAAPTRPFEDQYRSMTWDEIVAAARGHSAYFFMWGGSAPRNAYVNQFVATAVKALYNVELKQVPISNTREAVDKVLAEKQAGKLKDGSVDLIWINGENFRTAQESKLLFGPWADLLPTRKWIDWNDPAVAFDFGYPVNYYESPWSSAHFVIEYDTARTPTPPDTIDALFAWIRQHPGRFTYPAPPDFTGDVFVRHIFYWAAGGPRRLLGPFNEQVYSAVAPKVWKALNDIKPYLWRKGATYPESSPKLVEIFAEGEVDFNMTYSPGNAASLIRAGRYPRTVRTYVFKTGTIANTNYVAIPFNSPNKAAAMVVANFLATPEGQYEAAKPDVLGQVPVLSVDRLPANWRERFSQLPHDPATLPVSILTSHSLPELQSTWLLRIERDWIANVLQK